MDDAVRHSGSVRRFGCLVRARSLASVAQRCANKSADKCRPVRRHPEQVRRRSFDKLFDKFWRGDAPIYLEACAARRPPNEAVGDFDRVF
jgi:hypothetical protein